jgi:glutathione S-transferase
MIELYTAPTPNGHKVSCLLEALEMDYKAILVNLGEGEQKKPDFLKISPNGRIPAIIDTDNNLSIFESGAIMIYLADKADKLISSDPIKRAKVTEWLMFQMGGVGPMMGQANVFFRYFPEKIQPAIDRYQNESRRLFEVLNTHLENNEWLADEYSIADIANWCWVRTHKWSGVTTDGLEHLERWKNAMYEQPGMLKGIKVPIEIDIEKRLKDEEGTKEFIKNAQKMVKK